MKERSDHCEFLSSHSKCRQSVSEQAKVDFSSMSTVAEPFTCLLHSISLLSLNYQPSITTKSAFFFPPISLKLPSQQLLSFTYPLSRLSTLRRYFQRRISHLEGKEGRASPDFEQIHQDQKINLKHLKSLSPSPPHSLQLVSFLYTLYSVFITSSRLFTSPHLSKLYQKHSLQLPQNSSYTSLLPRFRLSTPHRHPSAHRH